MCAVRLKQLTVGRVVVRERQRGQGLPESLGQSQILRGRILELGQLHFILQDYKSVCLDGRYEKSKMSSHVSFNPTSDRATTVTVSVCPALTVKSLK